MPKLNFLCDDLLIVFDLLRDREVIKQRGAHPLPEVAKILQQKSVSPSRQSSPLRFMQRGSRHWRRRFIRTSTATSAQVKEGKRAVTDG
jgi:hypothetical protein